VPFVEVLTTLRCGAGVRSPGPQLPKSAIDSAPGSRHKRRKPGAGIKPNVYPQSNKLLMEFTMSLSSEIDVTYDGSPQPPSALSASARTVPTV